MATLAATVESIRYWQSVKSEPQLLRRIHPVLRAIPDRPAINVGHEVTYRELGERAKCLAAALQSEMTTGGGPLTAVFAYGRKQHMRRYSEH